MKVYECEEAVLYLFVMDGECQGQPTFLEPNNNNSSNVQKREKVEETPTADASLEPCAVQCVKAIQGCMVTRCIHKVDR